MRSAQLRFDVGLVDGDFDVLVSEQEDRRVVERDAPKLVRVREDVEAEDRGDNPLGDGARDVVLPPSIRRVPLPWVVALVQYVRDDARDGNDQEEDGAQSGQSESNFGEQECARVWLDVERNHRLDPEVDRSASEAEHRAHVMGDADVRLLEVRHDAAAEARQDSDPQRPIVEFRRRWHQIQMMVRQLLNLSESNVDDDAQKHTPSVYQLPKDTTFGRVRRCIADVRHCGHDMPFQNRDYVRADECYLKQKKHHDRK